jgi:hypothetical protein
MSTYVKCPEQVTTLAQGLIEKYHHALLKYGVTIDFLFAHAKTDDDGQPLGPALKLHGYAAGGIARIIGLKDRVAGRADAEILLDGDKWELLPEEEQLALVDHELNHFQVQINSKGTAQTDDYDRPKLKMRLHDVQVGWFSVIAQRHSLASGEVQQAMDIVRDYRQSVFFFLDDQKAA